MRLAPRALAPSHPLHVMPSRITRNSHRPRASDRTMVASEATTSLAALSKLEGIATITRETLREWTTSQTSPRLRNYSGLGLEKKISPSGRGGAFFLTSLFIELMDWDACVGRWPLFPPSY
jgi:hypothetical protein